MVIWSYCNASKISLKGTPVALKSSTLFENIFLKSGFFVYCSCKFNKSSAASILFSILKFSWIYSILSLFKTLKTSCSSDDAHSVTASFISWGSILLRFKSPPKELASSIAFTDALKSSLFFILFRSSAISASDRLYFLKILSASWFDIIFLLLSIVSKLIGSVE